MPERKAAAPVESFTPDTGNRDIDEFMRRARDRVGAPKPFRAAPAPKFPYGIPAKMNTKERDRIAQFNSDAVAMWRKLGHEVIIDRAPGQSTPYPTIDGRNVRVMPLS